MISKSDIFRDACQLYGGQASLGYDWWWHSFTGTSEKTGEKRGFFMEFFVCNPALGGSAPVLGQAPDNKAQGKRPSYLMVKFGCWGNNARQMHRFFGWDQVKMDWGVPFSVEAGDCFLTETESRGTVSVSREEAARPEMMCDPGTVSWDLKIDKKIPYNVGYGAGKLFRTIQAFQMFWHAEGMKTEYSGEVILDGEKYVITPEECFGYADKNWGKDFTSPWVWLSSCDLISEKTGKRLYNSVFDIGGGCPKIGPVALKRKLLSAFYYEGRCFEFNFSKFWTFTKTKFDCRETDTHIIWHVEQKTLRNRMVTDITCEKKDMLLIKYEAPNGKKLHNRLWNGGNGKGTVSLYRGKKLVDKVYLYSAGCEYGEYCEEA